MASAYKKMVLITGANSGIGLELAAQLMASGSYHVLVGARSAEKGNAAVKELSTRNYSGTTEFIQLDITKDSDIREAVATIEKNHGKLDILVNNAGIVGQTPPLRTQMLDAYNTNAIGPAVLTKALEPLLKRSSLPARIVNVSSGAGSIGRRLDTTLTNNNYDLVQYRASKAALNMVTACQHNDYLPFGIKVLAYCPGFTVSSISEQNTTEYGAKDTADGAKPIVDIIEGKRDDEAGMFLHGSGTYPW